MLEKNTETTTVISKSLTGSSVIADESGNNSTVITFSASIEKENGNIRNMPYIQQNILKPAMYVAHMTECKKDIQDFNDYIDECLKGEDE
jgi:hypothetical protein|nr:MAG TPA: hypothetical protein [Caudoviricetes sp.]